jgi:hypothetical protein
MKIHAKYLLLAATCFAFAGVARAQFVTISDDTSDWTGSVTTFNGTGQNYQSEGEAVTGIMALQSVTYTFMSTAASSNTGGTLSASLDIWNSSTGAITPVQSLGTVTIPAPDTWSGSLTYQQITAVTYQQSFDLSFTDVNNLNPSLDYVVLLTNTGAGSLSFGLGDVTTGVSGPGSQYLYSTALQGGALEQSHSGAVGDTGNDWTFSDVTVVPGGGFIPSPEPITVAAWAGVILVAGLVFFRLRQRQGAAAAPAFATIA